MVATRSNAREFEIVLYGSTGDAGKAMAAHFAKHGGSMRWAIAGRSEAKLRALKEAIGGCAPAIIVADAGDYTSLCTMAGRAQVLLTAMGPYAQLGEPVVKACIQERTHYCDITGEVQWVSEMKAQYGGAAQTAGVCICSLCGYDCVPAELAVAVSARALREAGGGALSDVEAVFDAFDGGLPRGTALTLLSMVGIRASYRMAVGWREFVPVSERLAAYYSLILWALPAWSSQYGAYTMPNGMGAVNVPAAHKCASALGVGGLVYRDRCPLPLGRGRWTIRESLA